MSDVSTSESDVLSSPRLAQFQHEVEKLRVTGGTANPERLGATWGVVLLGIGVAVAVIGMIIALGGNTDDKLDGIAIGIVGVVASVLGLALWIRNSMTRYLRFWLIRLVYEQREQTDHLVAALRSRDRA
jgi:hypothetical protein